MATTCSDKVFGRCRCCLKSGYHGKELTKTYYKNGVRGVYRDLFLDCFNLLLSTEPKLTNLICTSCVQQLNDALDFKIMVSESEQQLLSEIRSNDTVIVSVPEEVVRPEVLNIKFEPDKEGEERLKEEIQEYVNEFDDAFEYNGPRLPIEFETRNNQMSGSETVKHVAINSVDTPISFEDTNNPIKSELVDIEHQIDLNIVRKTDFNKQIDPNSVEHDANIAQDKHNETGVQSDIGYCWFECDLCTYVTSLRSHLKSHVKKYHIAKKPFVCAVCSKTFSFRSNYIIHSRIHTGEKPYVCELCDKRFAQRMNLIIHSGTHTRDEFHTCEICDKKFRREWNLQYHKRIHSGDRLFACEKCDKKFTRSNSLAKHAVTHAAPKSYTCGVCDKTFLRSCTYIQHKKIHTGEKPHACKLCDKKFLRKGHLDDHMKSHTDERPFVCSRCGDKFKLRPNLRRHIKNNTCNPNNKKAI